MSVDGRLITDVRRVAKENQLSFFILVTAGKGGGKTFALRSFASGVVAGSPGSATVSLQSLLAAGAGGEDAGDGSADAALSVCWIDYASIKAAGEVMCSSPISFASDPRRFRRGSVLLIDNLDALWSLCTMGGQLSTLKALIRQLLDSRGCALVASARSVNSVPTVVLEWRRPLLYALPPLTVAAARRAIRAGFGGEGANVFEDLADSATAILPSTARGHLLLAMCLLKQTNARDTSRTASYLRWLETSDALGSAEGMEEETIHDTTLFGLDAVYKRACMLLSIFAASRRGHQGCGASWMGGDPHHRAPAAGKLLTSLQGTTGILFHGPSGCGKSSLARKMAGAFPDIAFFFVKCTSLFSKYLGESEERLRKVYRRARARAPSVVVLDDVDVIAQSRGAVASAEDGGGGAGGSVNVNKRMLAELLCELDGVTDNSGVLTIGTTSAPEVIDSALLRQGRLETLLYVHPLTEVAAAEMCQEFFASFDGASDDVVDRVTTVSNAAGGCTPAALRCVLRRLLEGCFPSDESALGTVADTAQDKLPLPTDEDVCSILSECRPMLLKAEYTFETHVA